MKIRLPAPAEVVDRRIQRTRVALREALMALMVECGWDAIDVLTLCERANIGRSTFYQHYPNKEELLKANFAGLRDALLAQAMAGPAQPGQLAFVSGLIAHVHEAQDVFRALLGRRSGHYVQDRFRELLIELVQAGTPGKARGWQAAAQAHYLGGALFELLSWWLGSNRPHKPAEIEALFDQWSQPVLAISAS
ncbi:TetR/AcrR family transcriptional regulator [Rhodoferax saidenbachensis]|uniref:AcrR family transcriptional regulator n=1 Tax=Rhodoferax saidenbachensis TaxID=1484693 RepID=A0ABU1ZHY0_9BURK|nr:TetR/AcrR family transcriptional regulator [Rhodoferax saidenbachensis]MDR7305142.1 AcrR family transcriptional regulator [Rhodoferax saidenbachensis]